MLTFRALAILPAIFLTVELASVRLLPLILAALPLSGSLHLLLILASLPLIGSLRLLHLILPALPLIASLCCKRAGRNEHRESAGRCELRCFGCLSHGLSPSHKKTNRSTANFHEKREMHAGVTSDTIAFPVEDRRPYCNLAMRLARKTPVSR